MVISVQDGVKRLILGAGLLGVIVHLVGCGIGGSYTDPRSTIIAEAQEKGIPMRSVEEDRVMFFEAEEAQRARLVSLLQSRGSAAQVDPLYRIGANDEIEINVFDVQEMNVTTRVRDSGFINLPLIGAVKAGGLTEAELVADIEQRLRDFVRQPQVSVFISNYGSQKVSVVGAVRKPGSYALRKGANSVLELVSQAGGVTEKAGNFVNFIPAESSGLDVQNDVEARARLALNHEAEPRQRASGVEVYLDEVLGTTGGVPLEIPVRGGDTIVIPEAGKIMVEGEVQKAGSIDLSQQMTLLGALASAGGITYGAKVDEIEIVRDLKANGEKVHLVLDLGKLARGEERDVRLRNGDIVRVPSDRGRRMTQDTWEGISRIINFGVGGTYNVAP